MGKMGYKSAGRPRKIDISHSLSPLYEAINASDFFNALPLFTPNGKKKYIKGATITESMKNMGISWNKLNVIAQKKGQLIPYYATIIQYKITNTETPQFLASWDDLEAFYSEYSSDFISFIRGECEKKIEVIRGVRAIEKKFRELKLEQ